MSQSAVGLEYLNVLLLVHSIFLCNRRIATLCIVSANPKFVCTAISKKVLIVNSRYWNRKELWASSSRNNLLLLALTLHNIKSRFII